MFFDIAGITAEPLALLDQSNLTPRRSSSANYFAQCWADRCSVKFIKIYAKVFGILGHRWSQVRRKFFLLFDFS